MTSVPIPALSHFIIALQVNLLEVVQIAFYYSFSMLNSDAGVTSLHAALNYHFHLCMVLDIAILLEVVAALLF